MWSRESELKRLEEMVERPRPKSGHSVLSVQCSLAATDVLERVRRILIPLVENSDQISGRDFDRWAEVLPADFVEKCESDHDWTVSDVVYWFTDEEQFWSWWGATIDGEKHMMVVLLMDEPMAPTGVLHWILTCAGAIDVVES